MISRSSSSTTVRPTGAASFYARCRMSCPSSNSYYTTKTAATAVRSRADLKRRAKNLFFTPMGTPSMMTELPRLWEKLTPDVDIVNSYKIKRRDPLHRIVVGSMYQWVIRVAFLLPVRDIDCDFRLIRRKVFGSFELHSNTGTITVELIKKAQKAGFRFAEAPVSHRFRMYGTSQFFN